MKNLTTLIMIIFFSFGLFGQNEKVIYANKQNNVFMHFNAPIKTGIVGNDDFVFIFDSDTDSTIGILKIINEKAKPTNLLVTTKDGMIYSYILNYRSNLSNFNYFIKVNEAINFTEKETKIKVIDTNIDNEKEVSSIKKASEKDNDIEKISKEKDTVYNLQTTKNIGNLYRFQKNDYFNKKCLNYINTKSYYFKSLISKNGLVIHLLNIKYDKDELYFIYEIKNNRLLDLDIDYLMFEQTSKSIKKRASSQSIEEKPIYSYQLPKTIKGNTTIRFIVIFKKFTISKKKVFLFTLKEKNGERDIYLPIYSKQINNPN